MPWDEELDGSESRDKVYQYSTPNSISQIANSESLAYAMGLSSEKELTTSVSTVDSEEIELLGVKQKFSKYETKPDAEPFASREIKRRTMWSCFIIDRYLSSGRARPQMSVETLHIQLPCSGVDFQFGANVKTEFLHNVSESYDDDDISVEQFAKFETSSDLGVYIRLVEIWGRFSKWSCAGGRRCDLRSNCVLNGILAKYHHRQEKYVPPWDERTEFFKLRKQLDDFEASLPPRLTFTSTNLAAHVGQSTITIYTAIHTLFSLCQIVLHREYIPFIPLHCDHPVGPLDEPTFPKDQFDVPDGFWEESAEHIFRAARDIIDIVRTNSQQTISIDSPLVGFAIWTAAFVGVYSINFPYMDTAGHMSSMEPIIGFGDCEGPIKGSTSLAVKTLTQMSSKLRMAHGWSATIDRMQKYYSGIIEDYAANSTAGSKQENQSALSAGEPELSLRKGGRGGGLREYKLVEKELKEFGSIAGDEIHSTPTISERIGFITSSSGLSMTPNIKAEALQGLERVPPVRLGSEAVWTTVNNNASNGIDDFGRPSPCPPNSVSQGSISNLKDVTSNHQQPQPSSGRPPSNSPSLISASPHPIDLNSSYSQFEPAYIAPSKPYQGPQQQLASYLSSAKQTLRLHQEDKTQTWATIDSLSGQADHLNKERLGRVILGGSRIDGFSDGLPFGMWASPDILSDTDFMQALWSPQFSLNASAC